MQLSRADVVLLNSDTIVTAGWLDAIMHCAATDPRIGTITPFSNNAEICSFPRFCEDNPWADGADPEPIARRSPQPRCRRYPDLPTGVGFCLYVRRALLDDVGLFDTGVRRGLRRGERSVPARRARRLAQRAGRQRVRRAHRRPLLRRAEGRARRRATCALLLERHPHYLDMVRELHRRRSVAAAARAAAMRLAVRRRAVAACCT